MRKTKILLKNKWSNDPSGRWTDWIIRFYCKRLCISEDMRLWLQRRCGLWQTVSWYKKEKGVGDIQKQVRLCPVNSDLWLHGDWEWRDAKPDRLVWHHRTDGCDALLIHCICAWRLVLHPARNWSLWLLVPHHCVEKFLVDAAASLLKFCLTLARNMQPDTPISNRTEY